MATRLGFHRPIVFLLAAATVTHASKSTPTANAGVVDFCTEADYGDAIVAELTEWTATGAANLRTLADDAAMFQLAATRYAGHPEGLGFKTLAAIAANRLTKQSQTIKEDLKNQIAAIEILSRRMAELATLHAAETATVTTGTSGKATTASHPIAEAEASKRCEITTTTTAKKTTTCQPKGSSGADPRAIRQQLQQGSEVAIREPATLLTRKYELLVGVKGTLSSGGTWATFNDAPGCTDDSSAGNIGAETNVVLASLQTAGERPSFTKGRIDTAGPTQTAPAATESGANQRRLFTTDCELAAALKAALKHKPGPVPALSEVIETVIGQLEGQAAARGVLLATGKAADKSLSADEVAQLVFNVKPREIKTKFIDNLAADSITINAAHLAIKGTTKDLSETNFDEAQVYFYAKNQKKAAAASVGAKNEGEKKTDAADKTEEKIDGDNKTTTNTTGSNSFVINRAPLLLAFLLF
uniref:Variant surface glycoprotein 1125.4707 n=1 Tax=Trypanosoma brucei TaxID=5691 RepID=A0A1J0RAQ3_9TRYP|nr:variant surface glycoprotein 1125.4707 [Trypanosoma brucei]